MLVSSMAAATHSTTSKVEEARVDILCRWCCLFTFFFGGGMFLVADELAAYLSGSRKASGPEPRRSGRPNVFARSSAGRGGNSRLGGTQSQRSFGEGRHTPRDTRAAPGGTATASRWVKSKPALNAAAGTGRPAGHARPGRTAVSHLRSTRARSSHSSSGLSDSDEGSCESMSCVP